MIIYDVSHIPIVGKLTLDKGVDTDDAMERQPMRRHINNQKIPLEPKIGEERGKSLIYVIGSIDT